MSQILVTGGAGFIGSHLVRALLRHRHSVRVLDNFDTGRLENLEGLPVEVVEGDIRDEVGAAARGCDTVYHLAAIASVPRSMENPAESFSVNAFGSSRVFEASRAAGVRTVVCASSAAVYGPTTGAVSESAPSCPQSPYGAEKAAMEALGSAYQSLGLDVVCLRFFNVYGPRQDPSSAYAGVISAFSAALARGRVPVVHGDGSQSRDFVHVADVVRAMMLAAERGAPGAVYNVGTGTPTSVLALLRALQRGLGASDSVEFSERRLGDLDSSCADITRLQGLGFEADVGLDDGLRETGAWYAEHFGSGE